MIIRFTSVQRFLSLPSVFTSRCMCSILDSVKYEPKPERLQQIQNSPSGWVPPSDSYPDFAFSIRRTRTNNLPIYRKVRNGQVRFTIVRKVSGDLKALEHCLRFKLGDDYTYQINELTSCVRVKGNHKREVTKWLLELGF